MRCIKSFNIEFVILLIIHDTYIFENDFSDKRRFSTKCVR